MTKQVRRKIVLLVVILGLGYLAYTGKLDPGGWMEKVEKSVEKGSASGPFSKELNEAVNRKYGQEQKADVKP